MDSVKTDKAPEPTQRVEAAGSPRVEKVRLVAGHAGGWVNRLGRRVGPDDLLEVDAATATFLVGTGDFEAASAAHVAPPADSNSKGGKS